MNPLPHQNTVLQSDSQTTLASTLSPSPFPSTSTGHLALTSECEGPDTDLELMEIPNVFPDETSYSVVGSCCLLFCEIFVIEMRGAGGRKIN